MTVRNLDALFAPASVVRVDAPCMSRATPGSMREPEVREAVPVQRDTSPHAAGPTLALVQVEPADWACVVEQVARAGARAVVLACPGTADAVAISAARAPLDAALNAARAHVLRILGPGDAGLVVPRVGVRTGCLAAPGPADTEAAGERDGGIACVTQSSQLARRCMQFVRARGLGVSVAVALGDEADVDGGDVLDYLASDPHTVGVVMAISRVHSARKFMSAARACVRNKPVVVWCEPAAGEDPRAYDAAIERAGLIRVDDERALCDALATLQSDTVSSSPLITAYRAARERLAQTPRSLPGPHVALPDVLAWIDSIADGRSGDPHSARGPDDARVRADACPMSSADVIRLLACFDLRVGDVDGRASGGPVGAASRQARLKIDMIDNHTFGPLAMLSDGVQTVMALLPLNAALAHEPVQGFAQVGAWRPADADRIVAALVSVSFLLCCVERVVGFSAIACATDDGVVLEQASVLVGAPGSRHPLAIRPYPTDLEETLDWEGVALKIRPIRPEDETAHGAFFRALTSDDLRMRFFGVVRQPEHSQLARYVQIDYDREMALIACTDGESGATLIHGVVRAVTDPDNDTAEFAVTIRSDEKGHHLGRTLMDRIITYCRKRGTRVLMGYVLRENTRMLALARDCGFVIERSEDHEVMLARMTLFPQASSTRRV